MQSSTYMSLDARAIAPTGDMRYLQRDENHPSEDGAEIVSGTVMRAVKSLLR